MNTLYTIGHSTRTIDQFIALLKAHDIQELVDVRTIPRSRHNPQFEGDRLAASLRQVGIGYRHMPALGGLRHARANSPNMGWENSSFRGYADYMSTSEFRAALDTLKALANERTVAIMCAEAVPWRCHRSLIADALTVQGWMVRHITSKKTAKPHELTPFLSVRDGVLTYPRSDRDVGAGLPCP
jgi:uncharacterized protein (DUF488 family)